MNILGVDEWEHLGIVAVFLFQLYFYTMTHTCIDSQVEVHRICQEASPCVREMVLRFFFRFLPHFHVVSLSIFSMQKVYQKKQVFPVFSFLYVCIFLVFGRDVCAMYEGACVRMCAIGGVLPGVACASLG